MSRKGKKKPPHGGRREEKVISGLDRCALPKESDGSIGGEATPPARSFGRWDWFFAAALVAAVFLAYQPAWRGGFVWDDDQHVTRPELRSWQGLYHIWFNVGATLQYYPFVHSLFWVEHRLWGDATLGYHLVNLLLHATAAVMAAVVLRRLAIPGAYLAAAIFALHPLQVESVAWITEHKNTLSAVFYLGAGLAYLRFDRTRKAACYFAALGLFLLALLSKTVTGTLPGALLVIFWWQRGRLSWKRDVAPLLPFFLLGAGGGMITAWWELKLNECTGPDFAFRFVERVLIAGRAAWFLFGKLCWPTNLTFIYPRWQIDSSAWWQYLFPLGGAAVLAVLWAIRRRTRAPLAGVLFFGGTLFPVMGFFSLYTYRYSLVADHYQYLACLGIIALASAGAVRLSERCQLRRAVGYGLCLLLLATLAYLTCRQSRMYADSETLYRTTIERNPDCWLAHNNLAAMLAARGDVDEAIDHYNRSLAVKPDHAEAQNNLAVALAGRERNDEAIEHYNKALEVKPDFAAAHVNLGDLLAKLGRADEAVDHYQEALKSEPDNAGLLINIAWFYATYPDPKFRNGGRAVLLARRAVELWPSDVSARGTLAAAFAEAGHFPEAVQTAGKAVDLATQQGEAKLAESNREKMRLYQARTPFHDLERFPAPGPVRP
jgi:tetratricopeptide (TPR) repeat protein